LSRYQFPLKGVLFAGGNYKGPRVINDLSVFSGGLQHHTKKILEQGYKASYTVPMLYDDAFCGFIFINSYKQDCLSEDVVAELDVYCHVIMTCVVQGITSLKILQVSMAGELAFSRIHYGTHMARMPQISRCIAEVGCFGEIFLR
jgi:hypothetical protein